MFTTAMFHINLKPTADEEKFVGHMQDAMAGHSIFQSTRTTTGIESVLFKGSDDLRSFVWQATANQMTEHPYNFSENLDRVQKVVQDYGVVSGLEVYTRLEA